MQQLSTTQSHVWKIPYVWHKLNAKGVKGREPSPQSHLTWVLKQGQQRQDFICQKNGQGDHQQNKWQEKRPEGEKIHTC